MKINRACCRCEEAPAVHSDLYCDDCWDYHTSRAWENLVKSLMEFRYEV